MELIAIVIALIGGRAAAGDAVYGPITEAPPGAVGGPQNDHMPDSLERHRINRWCATPWHLYFGIATAPPMRSAAATSF
ncbi:hypothetical protein [Streptomyces sasae]|uniref:hypothetical protein n=1 Tax=Streptomyces sasae TaxID=1266772 RepID=UPI002930544E|nr:hypothetical protein [Streptomyces sasae]